MKFISWIVDKVGKAGKRGYLNTLKALYQIFYNRFFRFPLNLSRLFMKPYWPGKRLLGIWDLKALPWSTGDALVFIETLNVIRMERDLETVDFCIVYDEKAPGGNRGKHNPHNNLSSENARDYMMDLLPLFSASEALGSLYQFSSRDECDRFLRQNLDRYDIFPPLDKHISEKFNLNGGWKMKEINRFVAERGYFPHIRMPGRDIAWAYDFFLTKLPNGALPVTLTLKVSVHDQTRNADPAIWLPFIDQCKSRYPEVVFVALGYREERMAGLAERANVIFASDYGTNVTEQMALLKASFFYMATISGLTVSAYFSDVSFLMYQLPVEEMKTHSAFLSKTRRMVDVSVPLTENRLSNDFGQLYSHLNREEWYAKAGKGARPKHGHPESKTARIGES